jgi:UDP-3-O-[3-hydroxymyristoyl] glucosamine N-acyltransferase
VRDGVFLGRGVICIPPMYVKAGAYAGEGSPIDSHALIGGNCGVYEGTVVQRRAVLGAVTVPIHLSARPNGNCASTAEHKAITNSSCARLHPLSLVPF